MRNALKFVQSYLIAFIAIITFSFSFNMAAHYEIREIFKKQRQRTLENELKKLNKKKIKLEKEETLCSKLLYPGVLLIGIACSMTIGYNFPRREDYYDWHGEGMSQAHSSNETTNRPFTPSFDEKGYGKDIIFSLGVAIVGTLIYCMIMKRCEEREHCKEILERDIEKTSKKIEELKNLK